MIPGFDDTLNANAVPPAAPGTAVRPPGPVAFRGIVPPSTDMQSVRDGRRSTLQQWIVNNVDMAATHSIANGNPLVIEAQGNTLYLDQMYDTSPLPVSGVCRVHFQDATLGSVAQGTWITVVPGTVYRVPFTRLLVEWWPQPNKFLNLIYGFDVDFFPGGINQITAVISGTPTVDFVSTDKELDNGDGLATWAPPGQLATIARLKAFNGATWDRLRAVADNSDVVAPIGVGILGTVARLTAYDNGSTQFQRLRVANDSADALAAVGPGLVVDARVRGFTGAAFDRLRTPIVFKPFASTAVVAGVGLTVWTPAAGKKFRLMGWLISDSVAGQLIFGDNAVGTVIARSETLAAAGVSREDRIGNGILSAAANNVLKLDVTVNGNVAGMVWGTEE